MKQTELAKLSKQEWINKLDLQPHPEGGYYKETYRSKESYAIRTDKIRQASTAIYFMLTQGNFSAFHRIQSDEMWHFYDGDPISIYILDQEGLNEIVLGLDPANGQFPQAVVPAGRWFASRMHDGGEFALVGCTVAPGFDFDDFELANRQVLLNEFPEHNSLILELTRD